MLSLMYVCIVQRLSAGNTILVNKHDIDTAPTLQAI